MINLPPPLSKQEEKDVLQSFPSKQSRKILIERNLRLVSYIAKKFSNTGYSQKELFSVGSIGLIKAIDSFDIRKDIKLVTYASRCIENEILMYLRSEKKWKNLNVMYLQSPLAIDYEGNEFYFEDILIDEQDPLWRNLPEQRDLISSLITFALNQFSKKEIIIFFYHIEGKHQKEIERLMGISQSYISRIEKKLFLQLKKFKNTGREKKEINFYFDDENYYLEFSKENFISISEVSTHFGIHYQDLGSFIKIEIPLHDSLLIAEFFRYLYNC